MKTTAILLGALFGALIYFMTQLGLAEPDMKTTQTSTIVQSDVKDPTMLITGKVSYTISDEENSKGPFRDDPRWQAIQEKK